MLDVFETTDRIKALLSEEDAATMALITGAPVGMVGPDLVIAPDGDPYLYRWHVIPRNRQANVYFHIQTASDPERPLHDHPWHNTSVILSGGYDEIINPDPLSDPGGEKTISRRVGDVVSREASVAHRLILPEGIPYTMTLFTTGPKVRSWGFWCNDGVWRGHDEVTETLPDGRSVWKEPTR